MSCQNRDFVEGGSERRRCPCVCRCFCNVGFGGFEGPQNVDLGGSEGPNNEGMSDRRCHHNGEIGGFENPNNGGMGDCRCHHSGGVGGSEGPQNNGRGGEVQSVQGVELGVNCRREIARFTRGISELIGSSKSSEGKLYNEAHKHTAEAIYALDSVDKLSKEAKAAYEVLYSRLEDSGCDDEWNYETRRCRHYIRDARSFFEKSAEERHHAKKHLKSALNNIEDAKAYNCKAFAALSDFRTCINDDDDDCHGHHGGHGREFD